MSSLRMALALCASTVLTLMSEARGDLLVAVAQRDEAQHLRLALARCSSATGAPASRACARSRRRRLARDGGVEVAAAGGDGAHGREQHGRGALLEHVAGRARPEELLQEAARRCGASAPRRSPAGTQPLQPLRRLEPVHARHRDVHHDHVGRQPLRQPEAARPSPASPTTSMSGCAPTRSLTPSRTASWSSARRTRQSYSCIRSAPSSRGGVRA